MNTIEGTCVEIEPQIKPHMALRATTRRERIVANVRCIGWKAKAAAKAVADTRVTLTISKRGQ